MDLSKNQKTRRDAVEDPLWKVQKLLERLENIETRVGAAVKVWDETKRTLNPALKEARLARQELDELQQALAELWKIGFELKWKN
jgi:hypothetical protein